MPTLLVIEPDLVAPLGCRVSKRSSILRWKRHIARRLWDRKRATPTGLVTVTRTPSLIGVLFGLMRDGRNRAHGMAISVLQRISTWAAEMPMNGNVLVQ